MFFVGIIANKQDSKLIRRKIEEINFLSQLELVDINEESIGNIKNVVFDSIIITEQLAKMNCNKTCLEKICSNAKNIIINTDFEYDLGISVENKNIITYGCNQKATVTISSIAEEKVIISTQREFYSKNGNKIEIGENCINISANESVKIYNLLIMYIIIMLYK